MEKPKNCPCGGRYKRAQPLGERRDGSRYFACDKCGARIEQTADGYEFKDPAPPPPPVATTPPAPPPRNPRPW